MSRPALALLIIATAGACGGSDPVGAEAMGASDQERPGDHDQLLVADRDGNAIVQLDASGLVEVVADATSLPAELIDRPSSVRRGPDGALYVATFHNSGVTRIDGGEASRFFSDSYLEEPVELIFRGAELFVLGNDTGNVVVADLEGTFVTEFGYPEMRHAHDMAFGPDGMLYVATSVSLALDAGLQIWDADGRQLVDAFAPEGEIGRATAIAFDAEGDLYVADGMYGRVIRYDMASRAPVQVVIDDGLEQPVSLALSSDGALYVADRRGVHRFVTATGEPLGSFVDGGLERPRGVALLPPAP